MRIMLVWAVLAGCGTAEPKAPQPRVDNSAAATALRDSQFAAAVREGDAALAANPRNAQAAAVRAIARYQQAGEKLVTALGEVIDRGETVKFFDHERGRAAWSEFLAALEAIDRDLQIAEADPGFGLELCLACWKHDWNRSGQIDERDLKLFELEFDGTTGGELEAKDLRRRPTYHFDHGDILWARAMIAFQRAGVEVVLAYRWSELDKLFHNDEPERITIKLVDPGRVKRARELILAGLAFSERERTAYLAETDDDREWVPNPRQRSYAMPLVVDDKLYATWAAVLGDVRRLVEGTEGISMREVATAIVGESGAREVPAAFVDVGRMLSEPSDIVLDLRDGGSDAQKYERVLRGLLGNGYAKQMRASPLVGRLRHMANDVMRGEDTLERKLRYLIWLN